MKIFFKRTPFCYATLAALVLVCVEVAPWALFLSLLLLLLRFGVERAWWKQTSSTFINILSVAALGLVFAQYRTFLGQDASSTLLVLLASLRILDFRSVRDERLLILLGFILVALKFIFNLDLYWLPIGVGVFFGLWRSLLPADMDSPWRFTIFSALKSFPVVLLLFFLFPRVQVPWARTFAPPIPLSGMSESIAPGDISNLTLNRETAFRAEFVNYRPSMRDMYWRGAVLEVREGFRWTKTTEVVPETQMPRDDIPFDYIITLEPSELRVLPVLEHTRLVSSAMTRAFKTDRASYRTPTPIVSRIQYRGLSTETWSGPTVEEPMEAEDLPPKTQAWVDGINSQKLTYIRKLQALRKMFTENPFGYTRTPGTYENMDEFLFDRRKGFCEHYAGAYATLARAIGIPARVITGYQGGEWNDAGQFLRVSHADAHAWAEIRDERGSWRRVDPTLWIAPLRIDLGGVGYFQLSPDEQSLAASLALERLRGKGFLNQAWNTIEYQMENLNYKWTQAMLNFDVGEQRKMFEVLAPQIGWWIGSFVLILLLFLLVKKTMFTRKTYYSQATENFLWLHGRFAKMGFVRESHEAPLVYLERMKQHRPADKEPLLTKTIQLYQYERYRERMSGPDDWARIRRAWRKALSQNGLRS